MQELGGESFFKAVPDWDKIPIEAALFEHAKEMHSSGSLLLLVPILGVKLGLGSRWKSPGK
jgi:hypothetical protein